MFAKKKVKSAANRVSTTKRNTRRRPSLIKRIWNVICWPFRKIAQFFRWLWKKICQFARWIWKKICEINLVGLLNLALLIAIFVLCVMLVVDIASTRRKPVVVVTDPVTVNNIDEIKQNPSVVAEPVMKSVRTSAGYIRPRTETLPIKRDAKTNNMVSEPVRVKSANPNPIT